MFKFNDMSNVFEKPIIGQSLEEMEELLVSLNEKKFRGRQIFDWIYRKRVYDFSKMFRKRELIFSYMNAAVAEEEALSGNSFLVIFST